MSWRTSHNRVTRLGIILFCIITVFFFYSKDVWGVLSGSVVTDWAPFLAPGPFVSHVLAQHAIPISVYTTFKYVTYRVMLREREREREREICSD